MRQAPHSDSSMQHYMTSLILKWLLRIHAFFSLSDLHDSPAKKPGKLFQVIPPSLPPEEFLYLGPVEQT